MGAPPPLPDDLIGEILLRLPPDEPGSLVRASSVRRTLRTLLTDPVFLRRYREFRRAPPLLGFLQNARFNEDQMPRFVPTTTPSPFSAPGFPHFNFRVWFVLDCRHGRAFFEDGQSGDLVVWNPITGDGKILPEPPHKYTHNTGAVLCAVEGCSHLDCRGGPFRVVFAARSPEEQDVTWASVYSSETGAWTARTSIQLDPFTDSHDMMGPCLLAGDALYFILEDGRRILRYDLGGSALSVINPPPLDVGNMVLMTAEHGGLGAACVKDYILHLWSWQAGTDGVPGWAPGRDIGLEKMISIGIGGPAIRLGVVGFAEGADTIFVSSNAGIFAVELKSSQVRQVSKIHNFGSIFPFVSFYTPDRVAP